ncbi:MAG: hypothetical protein RID94_08450, partial [Miltoncostaeaceae bacterium]
MRRGPGTSRRRRLLRTLAAVVAVSAGVAAAPAGAQAIEIQVGDLLRVTVAAPAAPGAEPPPLVHITSPGAEAAAPVAPPAPAATPAPPPATATAPD